MGVEVFFFSWSLFRSTVIVYRFDLKVHKVTKMEIKDTFVAIANKAESPVSRIIVNIFQGVPLPPSLQWLPLNFQLKRVTEKCFKLFVEFMAQCRQEIKQLKAKRSIIIIYCNL